MELFTLLITPVETGAFIKINFGYLYLDLINFVDETEFDYSIWDAIFKKFNYDYREFSVWNCDVTFHDGSWGMSCEKKFWNFF